MSKQTIRVIKRVSYTILGAFLMALAAYFFLFQANIASGGVGGMSLIIHNAFPAISIGYMTTILNIILFVLGIKILGREFDVFTLVGTIAYSISIILFETFFPNNQALVKDLITNLVIYSGLTGAGLALVFSVNSSTGGTDILAKIIDNYFSVGMGTAMVLADAIVTISAIFVLGLEKAIYGVLCLGLTSIFLDKILTGFNTLIKMTIISSELDKINEFVIKELNRGTTLYKAAGGFTRNDKEVLMTIVDRSQYVKIKNLINKIDENAFVFINTTSEVIGEGFTREVEND